MSFLGEIKRRKVFQVAVAYAVVAWLLVQVITAIEAPLMLQYAELDERINKGWPAYEEALKKHGKTYTAHMYPGVNHGFHNDTTPRFDEAAAKLAEERTIAFFNQHVRS